MKSTELKHLANHWHVGDTVWASAFAYNKPATALVAHQKPVQGKLSGNRYELSDSPAPNGNIRYFVPFGKDGKTLAWSKVVNIDSRDIADTEQESIELYNFRIHQELARLQSLANDCFAHLIPVMETEKDEDGDLKRQPVWRADLGAGFDALKRAMNLNMTPKPDCHGDVMTWNEFEKATRLGGITDYDGFGDLCVDGMVAQNTILYITAGCFVIYDTYMVPFERVPEVFAGHDIKVIWFNK